jgi:general secretion pathway protein G
MMSRRHTRRGLTLLELMIVLIILVGLMAIVGPRLLGTQKKADVRTAQAQIGSLVAALKMYAVDMKTFPSTEEGLEALIRRPDDENLARNWDGPYIDGGKLPIDPWGSPFEYEYGASESFGGAADDAEMQNDFPRISSLGPDRQAGTADDISNQAEAGDSESNTRTTTGV